nr:DNA-binding response regulator, LuxR family [Kibdelosporangium sp. MJ126-NF4]CTQ90784.1 DNA-binding response regulator, LuxR family [Kibdelosporangium sp. MJ126-NF4]
MSIPDSVPDCEPASSSQVRIVLGDERPLVRRGLRAVFEAEPDIEVVAEAGDGERLPALLRRVQPTVVVLDADLPGVHCLDLARQLTAGCDQSCATDCESHCQVVLLVERLDTEYAIDALRAGIRGLLFKDDHPDDLLRAVRAVVAGEAMLTPRVALQVLNGLRDTSPTPVPRQGDDPVIDELTPREQQIFRMIAEGCTNQEIAEELLLSEATVKSHFNRIAKKLGLRGRVQAVILAYKTGVVQAGL